MSFKNFIYYCAICGGWAAFLASSLADDASFRLALTYGGQPHPGEEFTVTAWLKNPKPGQKVTLTLPEGISFAASFQAEQDVNSANNEGPSQVSWKVHVDKAAKTGDYYLKAKSENLEEGIKVKVKVCSVFGCVF